MTRRWSVADYLTVARVVRLLGDGAVLAVPCRVKAVHDGALDRRWFWHERQAA